jgi:cobalt-zinc-cadmium efflux system membrane fusion protein
MSYPVLSGEQEHHHDHDDHSENTTLTQQQITLSGLRTEKVAEQKITLTEHLFGVIEADQNKVFHVHAPYLSRVEKVHVRLGDEIKKGQILLTLTNTKTLQRYVVRSVAAGVVTKRATNPGDRADQQMLLTITDLSQVWVNMSAFPESIEQLKIGQKVTVYDLHQHEKVIGKISYIAPVMTGGHIARARTVIDNKSGHWRPGMHIKADISITEKVVPVAVRLRAIQTYMSKPTVFVKHADTFEPHSVVLGIQDNEFVEIISGLPKGANYVTDNSFLIKADLLKSSAGHDH